MAQKKVILKDGADELLPKTSASMVFTESGQTVEAALQNAGGGGGGTGGGIGEEQLAQYLQQHEYVTQPALDEANYLKPTSKITGYAKASNYTALAPTDTLNEALGKLEAGIGNSGGSGGGGDVYYLPEAVKNLGSSLMTPSEIFAVFGGKDGFDDLHKAIGDGKKIYLKGSGLFIGSTPVTAVNIVLATMISFTRYDISKNQFQVSIYINERAEDTEMKIIYTFGYSLNSEICTLSSSSLSDSVSSAVGGESGFKKIIKAVKDGNRLVIRDTTSGINQDLSVSLYSEEDNGNMTLVLSGIGYGLWGGNGGVLAINYIKSSNTFSCTVAPIGS